MKKQNLLKLAFTMLAMIVMTGAMAQIKTDYSETNATAMYQTVGTKLQVYVMPDLVYSPSYVAADNAPLGTNARWEFTLSAGLTLVTPADISSPVAQNWVEVTATTVGSQTITAKETNNVITCPSDITQSQTINVVAAPTAQFTNTGSTNTCGDLGSTSIVVQITENVPEEVAGYAFRVHELVELIDDNDDVVYTKVNANVYDFGLGSKAKSSHADWGNTSGASPYTLTFDKNINVLTWVDDSAGAAVENGDDKQYRTRYTYTLQTPVDASITIEEKVADTPGIVSAISQKSDYLDPDDKVYAYGFGATNPLVYVVNPKPITGPIYHIPNNFTY